LAGELAHRAAAGPRHRAGGIADGMKTKVTRSSLLVSAFRTASTPGLLPLGPAVPAAGGGTLAGFAFTRRLPTGRLTGSDSSRHAARAHRWQAGKTGTPSPAKGAEMATTHMRRTHGDDTDTGGTGGGAWQSGWVVFAAVMMIFGGTMSILEGVTAILKDDVLVVTRNYAYTFNTTSWGWLHLALGIVVVCAGLALFSGALWSRIAAVLIAGASMVFQFMWLPHYPLWALVLIAIDAFVIWAVCTMDHHRRGAQPY
jgi:hypothetical protein